MNGQIEVNTPLTNPQIQIDFRITQYAAGKLSGAIAATQQPQNPKSVPQAKTRGDLVVRFLESKKNPREFAEELLKEADHCNGFNLIIADLCSMNMVYLTNRPEEGNLHITTVSPGVDELKGLSSAAANAINGENRGGGRKTILGHRHGY